MTSIEQVTNFSLSGHTVSDLLQELNGHLAINCLQPEEYDFSCCGSDPLPTKFSHLIAFVVEGTNEGFYIHVGCISRQDKFGLKPPIWTDFGYAKTYSPESAYRIATECQRFLTATLWN